MMAKVQLAVVRSHHRDFFFLSVCLDAGAPGPFLQINCSKVGFEGNGRSVLQSALPRRIPNPWQILLMLYADDVVLSMAVLSVHHFFSTQKPILTAIPAIIIWTNAPQWLSQTVALKCILLVRQRDLKNPAKSSIPYLSWIVLPWIKSEMCLFRYSCYSPISLSLALSVCRLNSVCTSSRILGSMS